MRFICIFRSAAASSAPPSAEHMQKMQEEIGKAIAAGVMFTTGGIGLRHATGGRVTRDGDRYTVEAPPEGDGGWMAAGGFSIVEAPSREAMIEQLKTQLEFMGEGTVEFVEYKQFYPPVS
jgi:hypothetical protein